LLLYYIINYGYNREVKKERALLLLKLLILEIIDKIIKKGLIKGYNLLKYKR